jgi:hypothetical protein
VFRRKTCLVGLAKPVSSSPSSLNSLSLRSASIKFHSTSDSSEKIHEVTFWDFAGQDAYQVAHSLFFSPRTLYLVCVDLQSFAVAYMQAVIFAVEEIHETKAVIEKVDAADPHVGLVRGTHGGELKSGRFKVTGRTPAQYDSV